MIIRYNIIKLYRRDTQSIKEKGKQKSAFKNEIFPRLSFTISVKQDNSFLAISNEET